jgi:hypothetical protein
MSLTLTKRFSNSSAIRRGASAPGRRLTLVEGGEDGERVGRPGGRPWIGAGLYSTFSEET